MRVATVCPLTIKEAEMTAGKCMELEVFAEQYDVQSEKKAHKICYERDVKGKFSLHFWNISTSVFSVNVLATQ